MKSDCIIPIHEFAIGLGMLNAGFDMFDLILRKKIFKSAICIAILILPVGVELCPTIGSITYDVANTANRPVLVFRLKMVYNFAF